MPAAKARTRRPLPGWPRLMGPEMAAAYCDLAIGTFLAACPVKPLPALIGADAAGRPRQIRRILYDRLALDRWIDDLAGTGAISESNSAEAEWLED